MNRLSVPPLHTLTRDLAAVASFRLAPETVITGARILSVYTDRVLEDREVLIHAGRIAAVVPAGRCKRDSGARFYDAAGGILAPGLVDPHVHIESSMVTACAFAEAALLNGTTTIFADSHEIGNVCGEQGIEWMLEDARGAPLNIFLTVPSTIPATTEEFETAGGDLSPQAVGRLFDRWPEAVALGEKMDFVQVALGDPRSHAIIQQALARGLPVCGHVYGQEFVAAYAASGITDTHEAVSREIADDLLEAGLWVFLRGGPPTTPWHSLPAAVRTITELMASSKRVCVCTDDRDTDDLFHFGLDWVVRQAVAAGVPKPPAWSLGSLHPATRYGMDGELGGLGHGRRADIVLLNDDLEPQNTWYGGTLVVEHRKITPVLDEALSQRYAYPRAAYATVQIPEIPRLTPELPPVPCRAHVIRVAPGIATIHETIDVAAGMSWPELLARHRLCFLAVLERYGRGGGAAHGLLADFGLTAGAVASSVGHDAHNLIVAGVAEAEMRRAVEAVRDTAGGVVVVRDGRIRARVALPIAGLLSDRRAAAVAEEVAGLKRAWTEAGCTLPFMGFNLLPLSVIPAIRLTDKGLVTVPEMDRVPLFEPSR
jgi:adenine deaminase